jgi:hypothetical protein
VRLGVPSPIAYPLAPRSNSRCGARGTGTGDCNRRVDAVRRLRHLPASGGSGVRLGGMVNRCELLINVVRSNEPKMLTGSAQKGCGRIASSMPGAARTTMPPANRQNLTRPCHSMRNTVNPYSSHQGKPTARNAEGNAGKGVRRKRMPRGNSADRDCTGTHGAMIPLRKQAHFRMVFHHEKTCRTTTGGKANGCAGLG